MNDSNPLQCHVTPIFGLLNTKGELVHCGVTRESATQFFSISHLGTSLWREVSAIKQEKAERRELIFHEYGWQVMQGSFCATFQGPDKVEVEDDTMIKVQIATAPCHVLDWLTGKLEKEPIEVREGDVRFKHAQFSQGEIYCPSINPDQGHQLLEDNNVNCIRITTSPSKSTWAACIDSGQQSSGPVEFLDGRRFYYFDPDDLVLGETMLIAGLRAHLINRLGKEAEVPEEVVALR